MSPPQILISAGEASSEMYAARLVRAISERTGTNFFGLGGPRMREAGVELVASASDIAVVGIFEVIHRLPAVWKTWRKLERESARRSPRLAIVVDSPGFNLGLARRLKNRGVRVVYFISPQVWAWRPRRVRWIKRRVERMLVIFPFEAEFYRKAGVPVDFVGHPLVDAVEATMTRADFSARHGLDPDRSIVALLPGSRLSEIRRHLPILLDACARLRKDFPAQFVLPVAGGLDTGLLRGYLRADVPLSLLEGETYNALAAAECAVISSGTATVEAALLGVPMVVVYRLSRTTAMVARRLVRAPFISMVNLISGRRIVPELIQDDFTPAAVEAEVRRLLGSAEARQEMKRELGEVREKLGPDGAIDRAAEIIIGML